MLRFFIIAYSILLYSTMISARQVSYLSHGWRFSKGEHYNAINPQFYDGEWANVTVPHDWAIYGPFDVKNDLQEVIVTQDLETEPSVKTGRTGGLPYIGVGWYRTRFDADTTGITTLLFDGVMSEAKVYVNGKFAGQWPCGYNSFQLDVTPYINRNGKLNVLAVRAENLPESARWYSGAGIYRNVRVISTDSIHIPVWGTRITTPFVRDEYAIVRVEAAVKNATGKNITVTTQIVDDNNSIVASHKSLAAKLPGQATVHNIEIPSPRLWSPETPNLYTARTLLEVDGDTVDVYDTRFGVRTIEYVPERGFFLNGILRKFKGVCNHHDLGPLGAAVSKPALRHQLELLKDMGCNAIRTSHNMPAPELVELCEEMGFMMMIEAFDEWDVAKCDNGYHRFFNDWAERDMINMLHNFRNSPAVVMWSIGNEVPTQSSPDGWLTAKKLMDICHREDPTRPVTCGMDLVAKVLENGFASQLDIPGINYRTQFYQRVHDETPQGIVLGSETASTVSSRGVYKFPVNVGCAMHDDHQSSAYDTEHCSWSNIPDVDLALADDNDWEIGQFVWTGFDYLGEPSPYSSDCWPSHSSLFGIIDLASIPKDRYYLYRSLWNKNEHTLHVLPHWTWPERKGKITPVMVYTDYPEAELFINGKSYGRQRKWSREEAETSIDSLALLRRYRLMWMDAVYEPGQLRVVAYNSDGSIAEECKMFTAGKPYKLMLKANHRSLNADGQDLIYVTVSVVDKNNNPCPTATNRVHFQVEGSGCFRATANGDPTSLDPFHKPSIPLFSGKATAIIQSADKPGTLTLKVTSKGLKPATLSLMVQ